MNFVLRSLKVDGGKHARAENRPHLLFAEGSLLFDSEGDLVGEGVIGVLVDEGDFVEGGAEGVL